VHRPTVARVNHDFGGTRVNKRIDVPGMIGLGNYREKNSTPASSTKSVLCPEREAYELPDDSERNSLIEASTSGCSSSQNLR
jgi:hypothetical protein